MNTGRRLLFITLQVLLLLLAAPHARAQSAPPVSPTSGTPPYEDYTIAAGIEMPREGNERITGQAWGDFDGDGWLDLYLTDFYGPNRLYRNNGDGTFSLSPLSEQVALPEADSNGAVFADYDNDGWQDLYVANWGANVLYHNDGGRGFTDVTAAAGVGDSLNSKSASWGDYDNDGYLDLYVANWSCTPRCGRPTEGDKDSFYRNNGDGTFTNVTSLLSSRVFGAGFIGSFVDYDNDNDLDIYLVNDEFLNPVGNALWRNDGPGCDGWCFSDVADEAGANQTVMGMGLAVGDYDNDLDLDLYFSNVGPLTLLNNQGDGTFVDVAAAAGVDLPESIGWVTIFFDYNNDGWQDLYLAMMAETDGGIGFNPLFHNNGDGTFTNLADGSGASDAGKSIGVAAADYDRDGDIDLVVGNHDEGYKLYRNMLTDRSKNGNWFAIRLSGGGPINRDAIGATLYLTDNAGNVRMQQVNNGTGLCGNSALELHVGLGEAKVRSARVVWPDGTEQTFDRLRTNSRYMLAYGGEPVALDQPSFWAKWGSVAAAIVVVAFGLGLAALLLVALRRLRTSRLRPQAPHITGARRAIPRPLLNSILIIALSAGAALMLWQARDSLAERLAVVSGRGVVDGRLLLLASKHGVTELDLGPLQDPAKVRLGEALFFDKELSGNRDISCATCHHPQLASADGLPLSFGTGGHGLGPARARGENRLQIPRNAPELFNRGSPEWQTMFWDGRVNLSEVYGLSSPIGNGLPSMLLTVLEAQAMFPVTSREEMRGNYSEYGFQGRPNELGLIDNMSPRLMWAAIMKRLLSIPGYVELFQAAYPDTPVESLGFEHAAAAIAAYEIAVFSFNDAPWDRYLAGDHAALSEDARQGALLFYGKAECASCHGGNLLTDQQFHNLAVPQLGPGKLSDNRSDLGRFLETGKTADRYAFRTPPLRNVTLTAPYMHNGAYATLADAVRHHLDPRAALTTYDAAAQLPEAFRGSLNRDPALRDDMLVHLDRRLAQPTRLSAAEVEQLLAFLAALTSPAAADLERLIPDSVPSGLPVAD